jgi:hypothetical protein
MRSMRSFSRTTCVALVLCGLWSCCVWGAQTYYTFTVQVARDQFSSDIQYNSISNELTAWATKLGKDLNAQSSYFKQPEILLGLKPQSFSSPIKVTLTWDPKDTRGGVANVKDGLITLNRASVASVNDFGGILVHETTHWLFANRVGTLAYKWDQDLRLLINEALAYYVQDMYLKKDKKPANLASVARGGLTGADTWRAVSQAYAKLSQVGGDESALLFTEQRLVDSAPRYFTSFGYYLAYEWYNRAKGLMTAVPPDYLDPNIKNALNAFKKPETAVPAFLDGMRVNLLSGGGDAELAFQAVYKRSFQDFYNSYVYWVDPSFGEAKLHIQPYLVAVQGKSSGAAGKWAADFKDTGSAHLADTSAKNYAEMQRVVNNAKSLVSQDQAQMNQWVSTWYDASVRMAQVWGDFDQRAKNFGAAFDYRFGIWNDQAMPGLYKGYSAALDALSANLIKTAPCGYKPYVWSRGAYVQVSFPSPAPPFRLPPGVTPPPAPAGP